jgi:hypothetical protein
MQSNKRYSLFIAIFLLTIRLSNGQTNVGGVISTNTVWTVAGTPYVVIQNIIVDTNTTLIIEPGVSVKFQQGLSMKILGTLRAIGNKDSMILFTSNKLVPNFGDWRGITFDDISYDFDFNNLTGSTMQYCIVEFSGGGSFPVYSAISGTNSSPFITRSILRNNSYRVVSFLLNNKFKFTYNTLIDNSYNNTFPMFYFSGNSNTEISYNIFCNNVGSSGIPEILRLHGDCNFSNNILVNNAGDIMKTNLGVNVTNNTIVYNTGSIVINDYDTLKYNTLMGNSSLVLMYNIDSSAQYSHNNIYNLNSKIGISNSVIRQWLYTPNTDARNNWWGTTNYTDIADAITDYDDDTSLSRVNYIPILTSPDTIAPVTLPTNVFKTDLGGGDIKVSWTANSESDIAGYKIYWKSKDCLSFYNVIDVGNTTTYTLSGINFSDAIAVTAYDNLKDGTDDQFDGNESWYSYAQVYNLIEGLNSVNNSSFSVYPNPFSSMTTLKTDKILNNAIYTVINYLGQPVRQIKNNSNQIVALYRDNLPNGLYTEDSVITAIEKVIITD